MAKRLLCCQSIFARRHVRPRFRTVEHAEPQRPHACEELRSRSRHSTGGSALDVTTNVTGVWLGNPGKVCVALKIVFPSFSSPCFPFRTSTGVHPVDLRSVHCFLKTNMNSAAAQVCMLLTRSFSKIAVTWVGRVNYSNLAIHIVSPLLPRLSGEVRFTRSYGHHVCLHFIILYHFMLLVQTTFAL